MVELSDKIRVVKKHLAKVEKELNVVAKTITQKEKSLKAVKEMIKKLPDKKETPKRKYVRKVLSEEQKAENKKKRAAAVIAKNFIPDKTTRALSATNLFKQKIVPLSLARTEGQKTQIKLTAAQRYALLTQAEKDDETNRKKVLAATSAKRRRDAIKNETSTQKAEREARATKRKSKLDKGFFVGMFPTPKVEKKEKTARKRCTVDKKNGKN